MAVVNVHTLQDGTSYTYLVAAKAAPKEGSQTPEGDICGVFETWYIPGAVEAKAFIFCEVTMTGAEFKATAPSETKEKPMYVDLATALTAEELEAARDRDQDSPAVVIDKVHVKAKV